MTGEYGSQGGGVYQSPDLGVTWIYPPPQSGNTGGACAWGTPQNVYAMFGWANPGGGVGPNFAIAPQPATSAWESLVPTPSGMINGPKRVAVTNDGMNYIFVGGMYQAGIWRYIER